MKNLIIALLIWTILIASVLTVYNYAKDLSPEIAPPENVYIEITSDTATLKWTASQYATNYAIFRWDTDKAAWTLDGTSTSCKYTITTNNINNKYCVRAGNYSMNKYSWSKFSSAATIVNK